MTIDAGQFFEILGTTGSIIMCASSIPQIVKTYRMKCAEGISGSYLAVLMIGMTLILIYALSVRDVVFIFGNIVSLALTAILIGLRIQYRGGIGRNPERKRRKEERKINHRSKSPCKTEGNRIGRRAAASSME